MRIASLTKSSLAHKKSQGLRVGTIPLGKRLAADGKHLEDNPIELEAVEKIRANARRHAEILEELAALRARLNYYTGEARREAQKRERVLIKEKKATSYLGTARELNAGIGDRYPTRKAKAWSVSFVRQFVERR